MIKRLVAALYLWLSAELTLSKVNDHPEYTNVWMVKVIGGERMAHRVARYEGFVCRGQLDWLDDYYEFEREGHPKVSSRSSDRITRGLMDWDEVPWAKQQVLRRVVDKDLNDEDEEESEEDNRLVQFIRSEVDRLKSSGLLDQCKSIFACIKFSFQFKHIFKTLRQGNLSSLGTFSSRPAPHKQLLSYQGTTKNIKLLRRKVSAYAIEFSDPLWMKQWYFQDYRTSDVPVMDHNVVPVYRMGYKGQGVTVAVVDTAIQVDHQDLKDNIDMDLSHDLCSDLPLAAVVDRLSPATHGTSCAGVIGMVADNNKCGVGVAYQASIAAINHRCQEPRPLSDSAKAHVLHLDRIDIYSNSWGPNDDPSKVYTIDELALSAYITGVTEGRQGKGSIYIHSAGNGGHHGDNCATDYTINNPYVLGITSANQYGRRSHYSERCSAIFATTYSGSRTHHKMKNAEGTVTLNTDDRCRLTFQGTSASCPLAAGMIALVLNANSELSYRDVMHIVAMTSEVAPLANNHGSWYMNGHGFWVSNDFGFGLMNAENMVLLAQRWQTVTEKNTCSINVKVSAHESLNEQHPVSVPFVTQACQETSDKGVYYLEHVEVASLVDYPGCRGDLSVAVISPAKTRSVLLEPRFKDCDRDGLEGWSIMSTHNWGENPKGLWTIEVSVLNTKRSKGFNGKVNEFTIKFHGLPERPNHLENLRKYAAFRLANGQDETGQMSSNDVSSTNSET